MTFWRTYYHLVRGTKNREPLITADIEERLSAYLVRKAAELEVFTYAVNGWYDHVHMVVAIPPKHAVADVVKFVKGASSYDLNHVVKPDSLFAWQRGYGVLTLGEKQRTVAVQYVEAQKEHHQQRTTNIWLERAPEEDEGPIDAGILLDAVPTLLHETRALYNADDPFPF